MRTISRFALTATLALGASFGFVGIKPVGADNGECDRRVLNSASEAIERSSVSVIKQAPRWTNSLDNDDFEPEPNQPPTGTGGSGTR